MELVNVKNNNIIQFFFVWGIVLVLNQIFLFGDCLYLACIGIVLPFTGIIAWIIMLWNKKDNDIIEINNPINPDKWEPKTKTPEQQSSPKKKSENKKVPHKNWDSNYKHKKTQVIYKKFEFDFNGWSTEKLYLPYSNTNEYINIHTGDKYNRANIDYYGKKKNVLNKESLSEQNTASRGTVKEKKWFWYNNGKKNKKIYEEDIVPKGFVKGFITRKTKKDNKPKEIQETNDNWMQKLWDWADENEVSEDILPRNKQNLIDLTELFLENNSFLKALPKEIGKLINLTKLSLNNNNLSLLPKEIWELTNLTWLDLGNNELSELPKEIGQLTNLTWLNLQGSKVIYVESYNDYPEKYWFTQLPKEIGQLINLLELNFANNELTQLPKEIWKLTNLTKLNLEGNNFSELPKEIGQLSDLLELNLSGNGLIDLPKEIGQLTNLTELQLGNAIVNFVGFENESWIAEIGNNLTHLPSQLGQLNNLLVLDLAQNKLVELPKEIGQLSSLTSLNLDINKLIELPKEIGQLGNLTILSLCRNNLIKLPKEIGKLTNLTMLTLGDYKFDHDYRCDVLIAGNQHIDLPKEIGQLIDLTHLYLAGIKLMKLPKEIGQLSNLIKLDLEDNELSELPKEMCKLNNLTEINLSKNPYLVLTSEQKEWLLTLKIRCHIEIDDHLLDREPKGKIPNHQKGRYFYHFTHIENLDSILKNGLISTNRKSALAIDHTDVANQEIQNRRSDMDVTCSPYGKVHDYVPFYFTRTNPMLLSLTLSKNVDQPFIVFFAIPMEKLREYKIVFTDASANTGSPPNFYNNPEDLEKLDWNTIDSKKWGTADSDARHKKMAEALVLDSVPVDWIDTVIVWNEDIKKRVTATFEEHNITLPKISFTPFKSYSFYFTKFAMGRPNDTLVTGPYDLSKAFNSVVETISKSHKIPRRGKYKFDNISNSLQKIGKKFWAIDELAGIYKLETKNEYHNENVSDHTKKVVNNLGNSKYFQELSISDQNILQLSAYLHDIGKGPKSKWEDGIQPAYSDHPADAIPMIERILVEDFENLNEYEIRKVCLLVAYHDLIGDIVGKDRSKQELFNLIDDENELNMLIAISLADISAINATWSNSVEEELPSLIEEVMHNGDLIL